MVGGGLARILQAASLGPLLSRLGNKKMRFFIPKINTNDLVFLKDLLEAGVIAPVIDRRYSLSEAAEALRYRETGHAKGKVVLAIEHASEL
jgi:NADPH:quinone reductase-like Zn-dependent oxidoreductase